MGIIFIRYGELLFLSAFASRHQSAKTRDSFVKDIVVLRQKGALLAAIDGDFVRDSTVSDQEWLNLSKNTANYCQNNIRPI